MKAEIAERIRLINKGQVPEGYKKSKVGIIPNDWEERKLKDVSKVNQGLAILIENRFSEYQQGYYPYITLPYLEGNKVEYIANPKESVICNEDDILVTRTGSGVGKITTGVHGVFHNNFFKVKPLTGISVKYLLHFLRDNHIQFLLKNYAGTSTIPDLNHGDFYFIDFLKPTLPEQQKIATILSTWDKAIELKEKLISEKKKQKTALMQELLTGKKRLDGFDGEWEEVKISNILEESKITSNNADISKQLTVRLHLKGIYERTVSGTEVEGATSLYERKVGQFIYGKQNFHNGSLAIIPKELDGYFTSSDLPSFDFKDGFNKEYFFFYWAREKQYKELETLTTGTGSKRLNPKTFLSLKMIMPNYKEQTAIANILSLADKEISLLEKELEALKEQKKGLMQLLLTGIVRVN